MDDELGKTLEPDTPEPKEVAAGIVLYWYKTRRIVHVLPVAFSKICCTMLAEPGQWQRSQQQGP